MINLAVFNVFAIEEVKLAGVKLARYKGKGVSNEMRGSSDFTSRPRTQSLAPNVSPVGLALAGNCLKLARYKGKGASNETQGSRFYIASQHPEPKA